MKRNEKIISLLKSENIILGFSLALEMAQWDVELNVGRFTTGYTLHPPYAMNRQTNEKIPISWMFSDFFSHNILLPVGYGEKWKILFSLRGFSEDGNMEQFFIWRLKFKALVWSAHAASTRREGIYYFFIAQYENSLAYQQQIT